MTSELGSCLAGGRAARGSVSRCVRTLALVGLCLVETTVWAGGPSGGQVTGGAGQITQSGNTTTIDQSSQAISLSWQSFDVGAQQTVNFVQPNASSIAVNRVLGNGPSEIFGHLDANGQVWLINPNGVLFGKSAQVNVGGLVASTLDLVPGNDPDSREFRASGSGSVVNQGTITAARGGYVALLGQQVINEGLIRARLGTVALGAGTVQTLTFDGNGVLHLQVNQSTLAALVANRQLIVANGGQVIMTAGAKDSLLASVVNNTGIVQAETVENHNGTIALLGGGEASTVQVGGTLDAGAPRGGNGGSIETSAAHVQIGDAKIEADAPAGRAGTWLVDPTNLTIDSTAAATIESSLNGDTNVVEQTTSTGASGAGQQSAGLGDINVDSAISWANAATTLTLSAYHGINVNAQISGAGPLVMDAAGGNLTLAAGATVSGAGVTLGTGPGGNFVNQAGASAVSAASGTHWLIYSTNPTLDTPGGLTPSFVQYNASYGASPLGSGSGFLYSVAPTLAVTSLNGSVPKTYDGGTTATLSGANMTVSGLLNGDTVSAGTGSYASANAGSNINVTSPTSAAALTVTTAAGVPAYGYALSTTGVTAAIGTISPAPLTATIVGDPTKVYDGTTTATLDAANYALGGFAAGQGATVTQPSSVGYDLPGAGARTVSASFASSNFIANSGTNLSNYVLPTAASGAGTITQAPLDLTGLLANSKTYDGTTSATLNTTNANIFGIIAPDAGQVTLSTSGATGAFASANAGSNIPVSVSGFTLTGSKAADYQLVAPPDLAANIQPKSLSVAGVTANGKNYDSTTADTLDVAAAQLTGVVSSDSGQVTLVSGSAAGTFASANVGTNIVVAASGFSLTGTAAGNYTVAQPGGLAASITPAPLTISLGGNPTKTYDGTSTAVVSSGDFTLSGFAGGQGATVTQTASALYASPNAASNQGLTVTLEASDLSPASGTSLANYSVPHTITGTGTINPIVLTGTINNNPTKTYDGTTAATVPGADYVLSGFIGGESITVNQPNATYASANAGPETVTASLTGSSYTAGSGTLLSNYVLPSTLSGPGTIQPQQLSGNYINGSIVGNPTKPYDGTTVATLAPSNFLLTGWVGSDGATVVQTVGQYGSANAGTQSVAAQLTSGDFVPQGSTNLSNYVLPTAVYGTGTIAPAVLTASIIGNPTKVYDGTTSAVLSPGNYQLSGFVSGQGAALDPASPTNYASKHVGSQTITATLVSSAYTADPGTLLSNYVLATTATGAGTITPAPLYVTGISALNKVYDTTTAATLNVSAAGLAGVVSGDAGTVTLTTNTGGTFSQADTGTNLAVTANAFAITGIGASNYTLQPLTGLHANITPAPLTISGVSADSKPYDGTAIATLSSSGASLHGILGSDSVNLSNSGATGSFASVDVGNALSVTASGFALAGGKASDYTLSQPTGLTADITPAPITAVITGNPTKAYDGSNSATLTAADYTLSGFAAGQSATVPQSATASYVSANAGTNVGLQSTLVISDYVAGSGTNLSNYTLPSSASGILGTITPAVINLRGTRVYDAGTDAAATLFGAAGVLNGVNGETLTLSGSGILNGKNVGNERFGSPGIGSLGTLSLTGNGSALASNYTLAGGTDSVVVTPAPLTVLDTTAAGKVYDGTTSASLSGATLSGVLSGDTVTLGNDTTGTFNTKDVGNNKPVSTSMTIGGTDSGNYTLTQPSGITADITSLGITVTATGANKFYSGTTADPGLTLTSAGVVLGDSVTFTDTSATFADANVANGKTVTVTGISASGADAGDYTLANTTASTTADIIPAVINLRGTRVYDAATDAAATLFGAAGVLNGVNGETLTLSGSGILNGKNVGNERFGSPGIGSLGTLSLTGNGSALASNYTLAGGTDSVVVTPAPLTVL
ncbi:MAG TPA: YDG domain-containing protein, partial [Steroidobacteraceae bacterium]|nr:YDG domain-containing protein [Steroidobacteraceae bacterium]